MTNLEEKDKQQDSNTTIDGEIVEQKSKKKESFFSAHNIAWFSILLALVIVFQVFGSYIKIGTVPINLTLIPIILGGVLLGIGAGGILGFAFSLVVLIMGITGADAFTNYLLVNSPVITVIAILLKGTLAGLGSAFIYKLISKKNRYVALVVSAAVAPIINTGIFIIAGLIMSDVLVAVANGTSVIYFLIIGCAGINFLIEFAIDMVIAPSLKRVIEVVQKRNGR